MSEQRSRATAGQRSMWLMEALAPGGHAYNIALVARVQGPLDTEALHHAVKALADRHDALRTTFRSDGDLLLAIVHDTLPPGFVVVEASNDVAESVASAHQTPFDLVAGPLLRVVVHRDGDSAVLLVSAHHAIADFPSLEIMLDELGSLYLGLVGADVAPLPPAPQFSDVVADLEENPACEAYWRAALAEPPPSLRWPIRPQPGDPDGTSTYFFGLGAARTAELHAFCAASGASVFVVALAAFSELLARVTGQDDWVIGAPSSLRPSDAQGCVGFFVNTLPLRLQRDRNATFADRVKEARSVVMAGLEHRAMPFTEVVDAIGATREPGRNPLFQTMVIVQQPRRFPGLADLYLSDGSGPQQVAWGGLCLSPFALAQQEGQVDLALELVPGTHHVAAALKCREAVVPAETLPHLAAHFNALLGRLLQHPDVPSGELSATDDVDTAAWLGELNLAPLLTAPTDDIVARFKACAARLCEGRAVTDGTVTLSWRELDARSDALARHLSRCGVQAGERVGVALVPSTDAVVAMLAVMRAGAAYVPLDPAMPAERLRRTAQQADIRRIVAAPGLTLPPNVIRIAADEAVADEGAQLPLPGPDAVAYTLFTSGSTGEPKGIDVRHGGVVAMLDATTSLVDVGDKDRFTWFHAASFDLSVWELWGALCNGAQLVVVTQDVRLRPDALVALLESEQITVCALTPSALGSLADELERRGDVHLHVRHLTSAGEVLPGSVARRLMGKVGALWNLYGPAEATVFATALRVDPWTSSFDVVPVGQPLRHSTVLILDDAGKPVPTGSLGEVWIGGHGIAVGYVGLADETAQRFAVDVVAGVGRVYRTGDLAVWDGSCLHFHGRRDNQVKVRGYRIELDEVETALIELDDVRQAGVWVERQGTYARLVAVVVAADPALTEASVRTRLGATLPAYMLPERIAFVPSLPVNAHGKLDRRAAAAALAALPVEAAVLPDDPLQHKIAAVWCAVLARTQIDVDQGFFEVGGNSLALMRVYRELRAMPFAAALTPTDLFRFPTIRALADRLRDDWDNTLPAPAVAARRLEGAARLARRRARD